MDCRTCRLHRSQGKSLPCQSPPFGGLDCDAGSPCGGARRARSRVTIEASIDLAECDAAGSTPAVTTLHASVEPGRKAAEEELGFQRVDPDSIVNKIVVPMAFSWAVAGCRRPARNAWRAGSGALDFAFRPL